MLGRPRGPRDLGRQPKRLGEGALSVSLPPPWKTKVLYSSASGSKSHPRAGVMKAREGEGESVES